MDVVARCLRRGLLSALFCLPLLFGLANEAAAQSAPALKVKLAPATEGENVVVTLTLSVAATQTIDFYVSSVAAANLCSQLITCSLGARPASSSDFTARTNQTAASLVTFSTGQSTKTFSIPTTEDNAAEPTELFVVAISGLVASEARIDSETTAEFQVFGAPSWVATILDDDTTPTVSISGGSAVTEGSKAEFTVSAAQEVASDLTVQLTVADAGGSDFIASGDEGNKSVVIAKGERSAAYEVQTQGDSTDEPNADISVAIASNAAYTTGSPSSATVRVNDDDGGTANNAPTVANSIPNQTATAGTAFDYTFPTNTFSDADNDDLTYTATKSDGTALPTWLSFDANTRTFSGTPQSADVGTLSVKVTADDRNGGTVSDTFDIVVSAAPATPTLSLSLASISGNEGNSGNSDVDVTLTLSPTRSASTAFDFCVKNTGTAIFRTASGSDAKDFDIVNFSGGSQLSMNAQNCHRYTIASNSASSQVKLRIFGDTTPELDETAVLELRNPSNGVEVSSSAGSATYTINNDDHVPSSTITIKGGHEVREGRGAAFTLTASPARAAPTEVSVTVSQTGDFVASSGLGTREVIFPANKTSHTFTVATVNDGGRNVDGTTAGVESNGSVTVTVTSGDGYTVAAPPGNAATVSILDDDTNAGSGNFINVWGRGPATLNEDSRGSRHFMVRRWGHDSGGNSPTGAWGFKLCFTGTATPGVDYTLDTHFAEERGIAIDADGCTAQRTIPGSSDRYHFYITHIDDPHAEGDETIVVTVTSLVNVHLHQQPYTDTDRFTIVDDDTPAPDEPDQQAERAEFETAEAQAPSCVSDALLAEAQKAAGETWRASGHVERWSRVLAAFGVSNGYSPMTVAEAQAQADRGLQRWKPVAPALECLENPPQEEQPEQAEVQPVTPATPELSLSAGSAVDEGGNATFTVTADPAPQSDLTIAWTVAQSGEYLAAPGSGHRTVTLTAGATSTDLTVATVDDAADETDGSVSVTLGAGTGYTVATGKGSAAVTVRDNDATFATPELSLRAGSAVDEGGNVGFTVTADPAPQSDLTIAWTVAQSGEYLAAPGAGSRTVTLAAGATSTALSVATVDDAADEADGSVSVTLGTGTGYTVATGEGSAAVAVRDNDEPVVSITAGSGVTEGAAASFTVSASPVPAAPLDVTLAVAQSGDFAASGETGSRTVSVPVTGSVTFDVATDDDSAEEPDGSITATLGTGTGYTVVAAPDNAATVAVSDNDAAASGPTLSIADATFNENAGTVHFTVTLSEPVDHRVTVHYATRSSSPISARAGQDYFEWKRAWGAELWIPAGSTKGRIPVYIYNDSHDEDPETFELVLFDASDGVSIADGVAVGTITNSDPMPAAWLARFGRTVAEQALDGIAGRIAAPRTAGVEGTFAGQALNLDPGAGNPDGTAAQGATGGLAGTDMLAETDVAFTGTGGTAEFGDDALGFDSGSGQSYAMTTAEVLLGSSFTATGEEDSHGGSLALWGRAAQSHFDGREGTFSLDGEATTAMLGADYARGTWLLGMALMQSTGEGSYTDMKVMPREVSQMCEEMEQVVCDDAVRAGDGTVEATLTAVLPYAAVQASERLKLWGAAGHGTGDVTLKTEMDGVLTSDITWTMGAAGMRGDVIAAQEGPALAVTSDALWARTSSEKTHELAASDSDVTRLRLGLEGSWRMALAGGGSVTPKLETGARHDGGDAETGFGVEMGGGLVWNDPGLGLVLDLSGRTLVAHGSDDLEDRGFAASLAFDPDPATMRGPSLTLRQDWGGEATGGLDRLFTPETLEDRTGGAEDEIRWQADAAWGFPLFSGDFTGSSQVGLGLATGSREYSLGWQLTPGEGAPDLSFGLQATRRESEGAPAAHGVGLEATLRW